MIQISISWRREDAFVLSGCLMQDIVEVEFGGSAAHHRNMRPPLPMVLPSPPEAGMQFKRRWTFWRFCRLYLDSTNLGAIDSYGVKFGRDFKKPFVSLLLVAQWVFFDNFFRL